MTSCRSVQARFAEYLDGRLNGRQMQQIAAHLEKCRSCAQEWQTLKKTQLALATLGPVQEPEDLLLRIRVAVSQERARANASVLDGWMLTWKNSVGPFMLQAAAGFCSAVLLLGTVTVLVGMFSPAAQASKDEPLGSATPARLMYLSTGVGDNEIGANAGPVVVEVYINNSGQMYDYRIVSGQNDTHTRAAVENLLLLSRFEPARVFGQPVRGLAVVSFSGVSVHG
ncbi:zf-HC2 domain-containing protein [Telmatobacter bradus]|uniref:zf-HC2 domain-containing protein n=1 Tax=Telmatobacter bradus TaxID=474953 RepID=UPI003B43A1AE